LSAETNKLNLDRFRRDLDGIREAFPDFKKQRQSVQEWGASFSLEIQSVKDRLKVNQELMTEFAVGDMTGGLINSVKVRDVDRGMLQAQIDADKQLLKQMKDLNLEALNSVTDSAIEKQKSEALKKQQEETKKLEEQQQKMIDSKRESIENEILQLQVTAEEYEILQLRQTTSNQLELEKLETLVRQKHELERQKKDQEDLAKIQETANKKQLDAQIKGADRSVKEIEKQIGELEKIKIDVSNPSLTSKDERITSLSRGQDIATQQLEQTKRQTKIAELQRILMAEIARYQRLIAEKEDPIISVGV
jgi:hypothetical protein